MKNKKGLIIVIILVLCVMGIITYIIIKEKKNSPVEEIPNTEESENTESKYDEAYEIANSLYSSDESTVEFSEEEDYYRITVHDKESNAVRNIFHMDKDTMIISEEPQNITEEVTFSSN